MPIYEYQCAQCDRRIERLQKLDEPRLQDCPECGAEGALTRLISAPSFQFKGSGWYVTDYAGKGEKSAEGKGGDGAEKGKASDSASDDKASDGKATSSSKSSPDKSSAAKG